MDSKPPHGSTPWGFRDETIGVSRLSRFRYSAVEALSYNAIVQSWSEVARLAREKLSADLQKEHLPKEQLRLTTRESPMPTQRFDLNDIEHEPSDAQLSSLMDSVAQAVNCQGEQTRQEWMKKLREEIAATNRSIATA